MTEAPAVDPITLNRLYGRSRGKKLRAGQQELIDRLADQPAFAAKEARTLYRIALANYFAGALLMPYAAFAKAALDLRHDIARLQRRFEAGYEAVCHRLTTLQRPGAEGVPFFMVRVDPAGNVSKRYGGGVLAFARSGGSCPKWALHEAFRTPEGLIPHSFELPDGTRQEIFGAGGGATVAESLTQSIGAPVELLGQIPLDTTLREGADHGIPVVVGHPDAPAAVALRGIAKGLGTRARGLAGRSLGLTPSAKL